MHLFSLVALSLLAFSGASEILAQHILASPKPEAVLAVQEYDAGLSMTDVVTNSESPTSHPKPAHTWSFRPQCIRQQNNPQPYCVFTDSSFANGRGISVITTPEQANAFVQSAAFNNPIDNAGSTPSYPFVVKEIPGHGMGVVANRIIFRGENIMISSPVLFINDAFFNDFVPEDYIPLLHTAIQRLPNETRDVYLNLAGQGKGDAVDDIIDTNAFNVNLFGEKGLGTTSYSIVVPEVARLNHACRPNTAYHFSPTTLTQNVHAVRTIHAGEELTVSYIPQIQSQAERQASLSKSWGFKCDCSLCSKIQSQATASDERLRRISELKRQLQDEDGSAFLDVFDVTEARISKAELLISLYEQEELWGPIHEAYQFAAREFKNSGDVWAAERYARLALETGLVYRGPGHEDVVRVEKFLGELREEDTWG